MLSAKVEVLRAQAKNKSVMLANAGIQGNGRKGKGTKTGFPLARE
jgi:hypothetical protein